MRFIWTLVLIGTIGIIHPLYGWADDATNPTSSPVAQEVAKEKSALKADSTAQSRAENQEVLALGMRLQQASERVHQARDAWLKKNQAVNDAVRSHGDKDPLTEEMRKEETVALQTYRDRLKDYQEIYAQRKAAIDKLATADKSTTTH